MKNYKVVATRKFRDSNEIDPMTYLKKERQQGDEFFCTKERYEFLKSNGAVTLVEIVEESKKEIEEVTEKWTVTEEEDGIHVRPVVDGEIIDTPIEKVIKPKKKKIKK